MSLYLESCGVRIILNPYTIADTCYVQRNSVHDPKVIMTKSLGAIKWVMPFSHANMESHLNHRWYLHAAFHSMLQSKPLTLWRLFKKGKKYTVIYKYDISM